MRKKDITKTEKGKIPANKDSHRSKKIPLLSGGDTQQGKEIAGAPLSVNRMEATHPNDTQAGDKKVKGKAPDGGDNLNRMGKFFRRHGVKDRDSCRAAVRRKRVNR